MTSTGLSRLKEIEDEILQLNEEETRIRNRVRVLHAEHLGIVESLLANSQARTFEAAKEVMSLPPGSERDAQAATKITSLLLSILREDKGLTLAKIVDHLIGSEIDQKDPQIARYVEALLSKLAQKKLVSVSSNDGVTFSYKKLPQGVSTPSPIPETKAETTAIGRVMDRISRIYRSGVFSATGSDLFPVGDIVSPSHRTVLLASLVGQGYLCPDPSGHTYTILKDPYPVKEVPAISSVPVVDQPEIKPMSDRISEVKQKVSDLYRKGVWTAKMADLCGPMSSTIPLQILVSQGVLYWDSNAREYRILKDPLTPDPSESQVRDAYLKGISGFFRTRRFHYLTTSELAALHPEGSQKYPLLLQDLIAELASHGVLVGVGGSYMITRDPLVAMTTPPRVTSAASGQEKSGRLNPSSHGDYPPGVQAQTRDLLDFLRKDPARIYGIDDVVAWLAARGVTSRDIRTMGSHILASLADFNCLVRTSPGKYRLCNYRGYLVPQH